MAIFLLVACVTERLAEDACSQALFRDVDGDGVGGASIGSGCPVEGAVAVGGDCDDEVPEIGDRMAAVADEDGSPATVDCQDEDTTVHPGADEVCDDGMDNNCDSTAVGC